MISYKKNISDNKDLSDNQENTGDRVDSLPDDDPLKDYIRDLPLEDYKDAANQLSGEIYASVPTALRGQDQQLRNGLLSRNSRNRLNSLLCKRNPEEYGYADPVPQGAFGAGLPGAAETSAYDSAISPECPSGDCSQDLWCPRNDIWMSAGGTYSSYSSNGNTGRTTVQGPEMAFGIDAAFENGWGGGAFFRYGDKDMEVKSRRSKMDIHSYSLGLYGSKTVPAGEGELRFTLGGIYGLHELQSSRTVRFADINESHEADYKAHGYTAFAEAAYAFPLTESLWLEPFVNLAYSGVKTESAREDGGETALRVKTGTNEAAESRVGARVSLPVYENLSLDAELAWQHNFSDTAKLDMNFTKGGKAYSIKGTSISSDALSVGVGTEVRFYKSAYFGLSYEGTYGDSSRHHAGQATVTIRF